MLGSIIFGLLVAAISGVGGYFVAYRYYSSKFSVTNHNGDFGGPRGGVFALASGVLFGMIFTSLAMRLPFAPGSTFAVGMAVSMSVGTAAGIVGAVRGGKALKNKKD